MSLPAETYDALAPYYDQFEGDRSRQAEYLLALIDRYRPDATNILELGCGTGAILNLLPARYALVGIDCSAAMLSSAAEAVRRACLHQGDLTTTRLAERFDVVLCVYDTVNHLTSFEAWEAAFDAALEHLVDDGVLIFDMNTVGRLDELIAGPPLIRWFGNDDLFVLDVSAAERDPDGGRASRWQITLFEHIDGANYYRRTAEIEETSFPAAQVEASLKRRFQQVARHDPERARPSSHTRRLHFVCRK